MIVPLIAAGITLLGAGAFIMLSLFHLGAASDPIFFGAAACFLAGPALYLIYVFGQLLVEFATAEFKRSFSVRKAATAPVAAAIPEWRPEGLRRKPVGPLNRLKGRARAV
jgi:hypothetical protein